MTSLDGGPATKYLQGRVTFGVSRLWIPHVALIGFIYYVLLSPQRHAENQSVFWILGTYTRNLVGGRVVNAGVAVMWVVHLFEVGYTVFLARRYEISFGCWGAFYSTH